MDNLTEKITRVTAVFDVDAVINRKTETDDIKKYYKANIFPYYVFHNKQDFVHNGISRNGKYSNNDVYEQPKVVEKFIRERKAKNVLELATGKGASSFYLAKVFPDVNFYAMNLPDGQLDIAKKKARYVKNFFPEEGDYHDLSNYKGSTYDIVFVFEALCHSKSKAKVAEEVYRVLKPGGLFIVVDGYLNKNVTELSKSELLAKQLSEKGMVVENFELYDDVKKEISQKHFELVSEEDVSLFVLPSLLRFEKLSYNALFRFPKLGKIITSFLPSDFVNNAISGYLMPNLIKTQVACYYITVFRKV